MRYSGASSQRDQNATADREVCAAAKRPVHAREEPVLSRVLPVHEETAHLQPRLHQQGCAGEDGE